MNRFIQIQDLKAGKAASAVAHRDDVNMSTGMLYAGARLWTGDGNAEYTTTVTVDNCGGIHLWGDKSPHQGKVATPALGCVVHDLTECVIYADDLDDYGVDIDLTGEL